MFGSCLPGLQLLLLFHFGLSVAKPQLDEDCELHGADTMHDFCCELHDESMEFIECQMDWQEKLQPTEEHEEQAFMFCTAECAYNMTSYLAENRQSLDLKRVKQHLAEELQHKTQEALLYETYIKCDKHAVDLLKHKGVQQIAKRLRPHGCHVYPGLVLECVANEMILKCPADAFHKTPQCKATRDYLKQCLSYVKYHH